MDKKIVLSEYAKSLNIIDSPAVNHIAIIVNHRCNFSCHYCYDKKNKKNTSNIDISGLEIFLINYKNIFNKDTVVNILGGEPTLHPDMLDILRLINKYDNIIKIKIITNGSFKFADYKETLIELGEKVQVSISYHPGNIKGVEYYVDLAKTLSNNNIPFALKYMVDNNIDLSVISAEIKKLEQVCGTVLIESLYGVEYSDEHMAFLNKSFGKNNRAVNITYCDNSIDTLSVCDVKLMENPFKGMYCSALTSRFNLSTDLFFTQSCDSNNRVLGFDIDKLKKFNNKMADDRCQLKCCNCWIYFKKSINKNDIV